MRRPATAAAAPPAEAAHGSVDDAARAEGTGDGQGTSDLALVEGEGRSTTAGDGTLGVTSAPGDGPQDHFVLDETYEAGPECLGMTVGGGADAEGLAADEDYW